MHGQQNSKIYKSKIFFLPFPQTPHSPPRKRAKMAHIISPYYGRLRLKCDGTRAETRFRLSTKWTSPFKSAGGRQFSRLLAAEVCASAVVMLDTPCSEVVWRVLVTTPFACFPFTSPPVRHRVPSHFNWTVQRSRITVVLRTCIACLK